MLPDIYRYYNNNKFAFQHFPHFSNLFSFEKSVEILSVSAVLSGKYAKIPACQNCINNLKYDSGKHSVFPKRRQALTPSPDQSPRRWKRWIFAGKKHFWKSSADCGSLVCSAVSDADEPTGPLLSRQSIFCLLSSAIVQRISYKYIGEKTWSLFQQTNWQNYTAWMKFWKTSPFTSMPETGWAS